jgi:TolB protein
MNPESHESHAWRTRLQSVLIRLIRAIHGSPALFFFVALASPLSGGEPKQLTKDGRFKTDPVLVDKGAAIVFTVQETPVQLSLMKLKLADGSETRLHPEAATGEFEATFTRDEAYYAFIQSRGNLNLKMVIRDVKGGKDGLYDPGGGFASFRRPCFAPDGNRIYFSSPTANGSEIVSVNRDGADKKTITQGGMNKDPAVSPDGKSIVFCSSRDGEYDFYVMNIDGNNVKRILKSPGLEARPSWSPDGKRVAFTSNRDGNYEIYVCDRDGSNLKRITNNSERDDYAAWHPDGKRLVVVSERKGNFDLWMYDAPN